MAKEIRFNQITHQTYTVSFKNLPNHYHHSIIDILQKHSAFWNIALNLLEMPIKNLPACKKEIKSLDDKIHLDDSFNYLFRQLCMLNSQKEVLHLESKAKWRRYILLDGLTLKRYSYVINLLSKPGKKKQGPLKQGMQFKRMLLICCECMALNWIEEVQKSKFSFKIFDYKSLMPNQRYKISPQMLGQNQVEILTYERLEQVGNLLNKSILSKYSTIVCDDCQIWINQQNHFYNSHELRTIGRKILLLAQDRELVMILSTLPLQEVDEIFTMANLAKPKHFGDDLLRIERKEINNARWIKQRYSKENRCCREFLYLLSNTVLKNITCHQQQQHEDLSSQRQFLEHIFHIILDANALEKIQSLDKKYKRVNKKELLSNFQAERSKGGFVLADKSRMQEKKFFDELRQLILTEKLMSVNRYLYHMTKQLNLRLILIVQTQWLFQKIQKFLIDQQIDYVLYEIQLEDIMVGQQSFKAFNCGKAKLCVLVRDRICKEYEKCFNLRQKKMQMQFQEQAESQLGIQKGGMYELRGHRELYTDGLFRKEKIMNLLKVNSSRHIVQVDTFWYNFDQTKQKIISEILSFNHQYPSADTSRTQNTHGNKQSSEKSSKYPPLQAKRPQLVRHVFVAKNLCEKTFIYKYNVNCMALQQQKNEQNEKGEEQNVSLGQFTKRLMERSMRRCQNRPIIKQLYDIDDAYTAFLKRVDEQPLQEDDPQQIKYNNHIQGLIPQTPNLHQLLNSAPDQSTTNSIIKSKLIAGIEENRMSLKQRETVPEDIDWLSVKNDDNGQRQSDTSGEQQGTINISKYLLFSKIKQEQATKDPQSTKVNKNLKQQEYSSDEEQSLASSIHLQCDKEEPHLIMPQRALQHQIQSDEQGYPVSKRRDSQQKGLQLWSGLREKAMNPLKHEQSIEIIDVEADRQMKKARREKSASSFKLWSSSCKEQKVIGRKYKKLKVVLKPNSSRLCIDGKRTQQLSS